MSTWKKWIDLCEYSILRWILWVHLEYWTRLSQVSKNKEKWFRYIKTTMETTLRGLLHQLTALVSNSASNADSIDSSALCQDLRQIIMQIDHSTSQRVSLHPIPLPLTFSSTHHILHTYSLTFSYLFSLLSFSQNYKKT